MKHILAVLLLLSLHAFGQGYHVGVQPGIAFTSSTTGTATVTGTLAATGTSGPTWTPLGGTAMGLANTGGSNSFTGYNNFVTLLVGGLPVTSSTGAFNPNAVYSGTGSLTMGSLSGSGSGIIGVTGTSIATKGTNNTAVGPGALSSITTANSDVAIGGSSQYSNATGSGNVSLGYASLMSATNCSTCVAIGWDTMENGTTCSSDIAIGYQALQACNASSNVAIGSLAMVSDTSGANNTAVGHQSLQSITSGSNNTAIGYKSGMVNVIPNTSNCTFLGYRATAATDGLVDSTAIGSGAVVTASNQIVLGDSGVTSVSFNGTLSGNGSGLTGTAANFTAGYLASTGTISGSQVTSGTVPAASISATSTVTSGLTASGSSSVFSTINPAFITLTDGTSVSITVDGTTARTYNYTLACAGTGLRTLFFSTTPIQGTVGTILISGTVARSLAFPANSALFSGTAANGLTLSSGSTTDCVVWKTSASKTFWNYQLSGQ